jgi:hypothetical protein
MLGLPPSDARGHSKHTKLNAALILNSTLTHIRGQERNSGVSHHQVVDAPLGRAGIVADTPEVLHEAGHLGRHVPRVRQLHTLKE